MDDLENLLPKLEALMRQAFDAGMAAERRRIMSQVGELFGPGHLMPPARQRSGRSHPWWTEEMDDKLRALRASGLPIRQIAVELFGDSSRVGAVSGRIQRLGLPVNELARRRGLASHAARAARVNPEAA